MKRKRLFTFAALTAAVLVLLATAGCSRRETAAPADRETSSLVVYTYDSFPKELQENLADHFKKNHRTDVELVRFEDTGGLYNALYLERDKGRIDAFIGLDNSFLARIFAEDMLLPYKPKDLKLVNDKLAVDPRFRVVPFDFGGVTLNYDRQKLPDPPKKWEDLFDPKYKGRIILLNPATSGPGRSFLLFTIAVFGEDGYLDFWKKIKPNLLTVAAGWSEGYGLFTQGEAPIVQSYDTSPAYHREFEKVDRYDNLIFDDRAYLQVEVAGILKNAPNRRNAELLMDYIVSPGFQSLIPLSQVMYPVHPDAALPASFTAVTRAGDFVSLDEEKVSVRLQDWLRDWEAVMR